MMDHDDTESKHDDTTVCALLTVTRRTLVGRDIWDVDTHAHTHTKQEFYELRRKTFLKNN